MKRVNSLLMLSVALSIVLIASPQAFAQTQVTGHWAIGKGSTVDLTKPGFKVVELRPTLQGMKWIVNGGAEVEYVRNPNDLNLYSHSKAGIIKVRFTDANTGRIEVTNETMVRLQGTVRVSVTNRRPQAVLVKRHDTGADLKFDREGMTPDGLILPNKTRTITLPRGVRLLSTDLGSLQKYLEWYPVVRNNETVTIDGFSVSFVNMTNEELAIYDSAIKANTGLVAELPPGKVVHMAGKRNQKLKVLNFRTGKVYFEKTLDGDVYERFEN